MEGLRCSEQAPGEFRRPHVCCVCRMLEAKLNEAKSKKNTLKARAKSAQTTRQINEMIQGLNLNNSMAAFERMEEKVMALESESEATLQVSGWIEASFQLTLFYLYPSAPQARTTPASIPLMLLCSAAGRGV